MDWRMDWMKRGAGLLGAAGTLFVWFGSFAYWYEVSQSTSWLVSAVGYAALCTTSLSMLVLMMYLGHLETVAKTAPQRVMAALSRHGVNLNGDAAARAMAELQRSDAR